MPFGLINVPTILQQLMKNIFYEFLNNFVVSYLNNILIFKNKDDQERHVWLVMEKLHNAWFYTNIKWSFWAILF